MANETVWLDALPQEVCVRIAASATLFDLRNALHFGRVSPSLRTAVLQALNRYFMFDITRICTEAPKHSEYPHSSYHDRSSEERASASHHSHSPDHSASESEQNGSDHGESTPDDNRNDQSEHASHPSTPDPQLPQSPPPSFDLRAALQHLLRVGFGDQASEWTIREATTMEEFFAHCDDDAQSSHSSPEVHSNQDATEQPSDDHNSQHSSHSGTEEQPHHGPDPDYAESHSEDEIRENTPIDAPENQSQESVESPKRTESHSSDEGDSDAVAETSLPSDGEGPPDQETSQVPESVISFHRDVADFLGEDTRSMSASPEFTELRSQSAFQTCMASPLLEELMLVVPNDTYESFRVGPNLCSLVLLIARDDLPIIPYLQSLSSTKIRELKVRSHPTAVSWQQQLTNDPESASLLSSWFPNVEKLQIQCHGQDSSAPIWSVIKHFRYLKEVTLFEAVPEEAIEHLQRMERVTLYGEELRDLPDRIPERIVGVITNHEWDKGVAGKWSICQNQLERLGNCKRLEALSCCIKPGMEREFVRIAGNLRSLDLAFDQNEVGVGEGRLKPLRPTEGAILDIVQAAPKLQSLRLVNMRINRSELKEVLISVGERLEVFSEAIFAGSYVEQFTQYNGTFMFQKSENEFELELFIAILKTAALHNPKLKELSIDMRPEWFTDINAVRGIIPKFRAACFVLSRRAISLNYRNLTELFTKFVDEEIGTVHMFQPLCERLGIPMVVVG